MKINSKTLMVLVFVLSVSEFVLGLGLSLNQFEENRVGIHFGTTHFSVGVSRVEIIPLDQGKKSIPSWITFNNKWEPIVGREAKEQAALNPDNTIFNTQFFIGRKFVDPEAQRYIKSMPYKVVNKHGFPYIQLVDQPEARFTSMEDIATVLLGTVKLSAERYLNKKIIDAVITVPAYFSDAQKEVTRNLGESVGINVSRIISEPTAVAISYAIDKKPEKPQIILVYNLGALTFDVSIFSIDNGVLKVLSTSADTHFGGEDFDDRLLDYFINIIRRKYRKGIRKGSREMELFRRECQNAKQALTRQQHVQLEIDSLFEDVDFSELLTRDKFQILTLDLAEKTLRLVKKALEIAGLRKYEIDEILLVGSDARIPILQDALSSFFDGKNLIKTSIPMKFLPMALQFKFEEKLKASSWCLIIHVKSWCCYILWFDGYNTPKKCWISC